MSQSRATSCTKWRYVAAIQSLVRFDLRICPADKLTYQAAECLDLVCRQSSKDATLLYACVLEAQSAGDKRQAIIALEKVLEKYNYSAPAGIHLPALLR